MIQERTGHRITPVIDMPPPMADWARTAELSRLPADLAAVAYQYLTRYLAFDHQTRYELGIQLATAVSQYVSPPPPPQASPPEYLAAVLAERRRREAERFAQIHGPSAGETDSAAGMFPPRPGGSGLRVGGEKRCLCGRRRDRWGLLAGSALLIGAAAGWWLRFHRR